MSSKQFVTLAGNIGAGKSTAAKIIARHFGYELFHEPVVENRFLKDYYGDMKRWSFTLQMEFLLARIEHGNSIDRINGGCVQDRSLIEDPEVFAKYLHGLGNMSDNELDLYFDYFKRFNQGVRQPDKVVFLHTSDVNVLLRRIAERGREEEKGITANFLRGLNGYYETFEQVAKQKYEFDILKIDVTDFDFRQGEARERFLERIDTFLQKGHRTDTQLPF